MHVSVSREQRLWAEEVARLLGAATSFGPAVRAAVVSVLESLAVDGIESSATRVDARALLTAVESARALETALTGVEGSAERPVPKPVSGGLAARLLSLPLASAVQSRA